MKFLGYTSIAMLGALAALAGSPPTATAGASNNAANDSANFGRISGTAQAVVAGSLDRCGPKDVVTLTPVTPETEKFFAASFGNTDEGSIRFDFDPNTSEAAGAALPANVQTSTCRHGNFGGGWYRFEDVPAGEYFVVSYLQNVDDDWNGQAGVGPTIDGKGSELAPRSGQPGAGFEAVSMMKRVTVTAGDKETVHLRPRNALDYSETPIARASVK